VGSSGPALHALRAYPHTQKACITVLRWFLHLNAKGPGLLPSQSTLPFGLVLPARPIVALSSVLAPFYFILLCPSVIDTESRASTRNTEGPEREVPVYVSLYLYRTYTYRGDHGLKLEGERRRQGRGGARQVEQARTGVCGRRRARGRDKDSTTARSYSRETLTTRAQYDVCTM